MVQAFQAQFETAMSEMAASAASLIPALLASFFFLGVALVVSSLGARVVRAIMRGLHIDRHVRSTAAGEWLSRTGLQRPLDELVPKFVFWALIFLFARQASDTLGLVTVSGAIGQVIAYLPNVLSAFVVLVVGSVVARVAGRAVEEVARGSGLDGARALGRFASGSLVFVIAIMALSELQIDTLIISDLAVVLVAGVTLALALAFGLGARDVTRSILAGYYARQIIDAGDEISVLGHTGVVEAITPTQLLLRENGRTVVLANGSLLDSVASRPVA